MRVARVRPRRGCGAVGSATRSHRVGQGFDSPQLHFQASRPPSPRCAGGRRVSGGGRSRTDLRVAHTLRWGGRPVLCEPARAAHTPAGRPSGAVATRACCTRSSGAGPPPWQQWRVAGVWRQDGAVRSSVRLWLRWQQWRVAGVWRQDGAVRSPRSGRPAAGLAQARRRAGPGTTGRGAAGVCGTLRSVVNRSRWRRECARRAQVWGGPSAVGAGVCARRAGPVRTGRWDGESVCVASRFSENRTPCRPDCVRGAQVHTEPSARPRRMGRWDDVTSPDGPVRGAPSAETR